MIWLEVNLPLVANGPLFSWVSCSLHTPCYNCIEEREGNVFIRSSHQENKKTLLCDTWHPPHEFAHVLCPNTVLSKGLMYIAKRNNFPGGEDLGHDTGISKGTWKCIFGNSDPAIVPVLLNPCLKYEWWLIKITLQCLFKEHVSLHSLILPFGLPLEDWKQSQTQL